jgi:IS6 family transposase
MPNSFATKRARQGEDGMGSIAAAAKRFFRKVFRSSNNPIPRVINVDKNPAYPAAIRALKREGVLPRRVRLRQCKYLNNIVEQDHRSGKNVRG